MTEDRIPVLIAGGGSVGLATALFLAHQGVSTLTVESQAGPSIHPRATGLGTRSMEFLREIGLEDAVNAVAIDASAGTLGKISAATLATADLSSPPKAASTATNWASQVSPAVVRGTCPQHRLDSVLLPAARARGAMIRHSTRLVSFEQDADGVTAVLAGDANDHEVVRADYLIAADGVRSGVRDALGIGTSGPGGLGTPKVNILFRADLSTFTKGQHFVNCDITNPDAPGMLMTVDGEKEWIFHVSYDPDAGQTVEEFTAERCRALIRVAIGAPDLDVEVLSTLSWRSRGQLADRFADGRVFLVGDAARAVPPLGAFGLNSGLADAHNLAWKLAAVLSGQAGPKLLDSYQAERRAVSAFVLEQALLRLANPRLHWDMTPRMATARAEAGVFNAPIVQLGYRYDSDAVIDPQADLPSHEDVELDLDGTPGSRLPHVWVERAGRRLSTLDLVHSPFTLLTGSGGDQWIQAAHDVVDRLGVQLAVHRIAQNADVSDHSGQWPRIIGITEKGAVLVRPDQFIAWRQSTQSDDPAEELAQALTRLLARETPTLPVSL